MSFFTTPSDPHQRLVTIVNHDCVLRPSIAVPSPVDGFFLGFYVVLAQAPLISSTVQVLLAGQILAEAIINPGDAGIVKVSSAAVPNKLQQGGATPLYVRFNPPLPADLATVELCFLSAQ